MWACKGLGGKARLMDALRQHDYIFLPESFAVPCLALLDSLVAPIMTFGQRRVGQTRQNAMSGRLTSSHAKTCTCSYVLYPSLNAINSILFPSAPQLPKRHHLACHLPSIFTMTHLTGPLMGGKLCHFPFSKSTSRLNQSIGRRLTTDVRAILCFAVLSDRSFMSIA